MEFSPQIFFYFIFHYSPVVLYKSIWITEIANSESIRSKLGSKHGINIDELESHLICNKRLRGFEVHQNGRGLRTVVKVSISQMKVIRVVIQVVDVEKNVWKIKTARYIN